MSVKIYRFFQLPFGLLLSVALSGCLDLGESTNNLIKAIPNVQRTKKAMLFQKEAGATVADSYQLSIVDYDKQLDNAANGNAFIVDDDHGRARLNPKCIELSWLAKDTLLITYDKKLRTFLKSKQINNVVLIYKQK